MRVLLDESLPRQLRRKLVGYETSTVAREGWSGLKNGALLGVARAAGFDVLLTADQNLEHQQNVGKAGLAVIVLQAVKNRMQELVPLIPANPRSPGVDPTWRGGEDLGYRAMIVELLLENDYEDFQDSARLTVARSTASRCSSTERRNRSLTASSSATRSGLMSRSRLSNCASSGRGHTRKTCYTMPAFVEFRR
jgi:hypothetical protein